MAALIECQSQDSLPGRFVSKRGGFPLRQRPVAEEDLPEPAEDMPKQEEPQGMEELADPTRKAPVTSAFIIVHCTTKRRQR